MKIIPLFAYIFLITGCSRQIKVSDLEYLNGYWEIQAVAFNDGTKKEYNMNTNIDYIKIEDLHGYRKKVQPNLDGSFGTSDDAELFIISESNGNFIIGYETELSSWNEELITLTKDRFSVRNEDGITYAYKRFEPIEVEK